MHLKQQRNHMINTQILERGIRDPLVIEAMGKVERERFVPEDIRHLAYQDRPLPIGYDQTISQPYMVAMMTEALKLKGSEHVLEIGTGSGYAAAILAKIAKQVVTIERIPELANHARKVLSTLGYDNITVINSDGTKGCKEFEPYDAIVVTAGGPEVPKSLLDQLKIGGRLVIPIGNETSYQMLVRVTRHSQEEFRTEDLCEVRFVPLVGEEGWQKT